MNRLPKNFSRRKFLTTLGLATAGSGVYARVVEPHWLAVGRHTVKLGLSRTGSPLKILHLSDLHASQTVSLGFISEAVRTGLSLKPDLICLTGDFITRGYDQFEHYSEVLKPLADAVPTFACLGNHDGGVWSRRRFGYPDSTLVREMLAKAGITLLHNRSQPVHIRGRNVTVVGLGDIWAGEMQPMIAFDQQPTLTADATIVLSHNPDSKEELQPYAWDLLLSGHTHGGQVKLPFFGAPVCSVRDRRFIEGLHAWDDRWLHITRGVGSLWGLRFNCPPEISLLTLV